MMLAISLAWWIKNLRVGAGRCAGPRVSMSDWLMDLGMPMVGELGVAPTRSMHRVRAEVAGCHAKSANSPFRLGLPVAFPFSVGRPSTMVDITLIQIAVVAFAIVDGARPDSRRMVARFQNLITVQSG